MLGLLFCNAVKGKQTDRRKPSVHARFCNCSKSDQKPLLIKFLVTPVRKVLLPVVNQKWREKFGAQNAEHAKDQGKR